jgi:putative ABC transport system permease protein
MFGYYLLLAVRSLKRSISLTVLVIAAIAVGVSASMTVLTIYRGMSADPIPRKSGQLFVPQIDSWGPVRAFPPSFSDRLEDQLSYRDVEGLLKSPIPRRQVAMYSAWLSVTPQDPHRHPLMVPGRATYGDFFAMFDVPLRYGAVWTKDEEAGKAQVAVISHDLNDRLFDGRNSIGATIRVNDVDYRVVGVLDRWDPQPHFYDLKDSVYETTEDVFIPFTQAIDRHLWSTGNSSCNEHDTPSGWEAYLKSNCIWLSMWVELPTAADVGAYRKWLAGYASEQQRIGRFHWPASTQLRNVRQWLDYHHVVVDEVRLLLLVSFGFLLVCLLNATSLMLAKTVGGVRDLALRRALGARRLAVLTQCLVETAVVGFIGGLLGLVLTQLSLLGLERMLQETRLQLLHLDLVDLALTVVLAVVVTILAGLYPTLRAVYAPPAPQLKAL